MDAYDGGSGAPQGRDTSREAESAPETQTAPAKDAVPGPRAEPFRPETGPRAEPSRRETGPLAEPGLPQPRTEPGPGAEPSGPVAAWPAVASARGLTAAEPATVPAAEPAAEPAAGLVAEPRHPEPRSGVAALSPRYQVGAALALAVVAVAVCVHVGMVFLHVAPSNTVTKAHGKAIDEWIYPEFEQNWKLFAPNPLQQNIAVQVRAQVRTADGGSRTTGWYNLSAQDGRAIDGNLLPSHTEQNELRRAWDFFTSTHSSDNRSVGLRGTLSETYLRRIVVLRLERGGAAGAGGAVERIQVRSQTTNVTPPSWSDEKVSMSPVYRELPWWSVPDGDTEGGTR